MNLRLAPLMAALLCACATPAFADPVISEFLAANSEVLADEDGEYSDWIEIHNPGSAAIDLGGYYLSDNPNAPAKWAFPSPTPLAADGYLIVFASGKDRALSGSELHTNFRLNNGGESVLLVAPDGTAVVSAFDPYPQQQSDRSYGVAQRVITASYLDEAIPQILVPAQESDLAADWADPSFAGGGLWVAGVAPPAIGFDTAEPPVTLKNVAPTGTATQTSTHQAGPPERAIDGDFTNFSHTASPNPGEWRLDLPGPEEIHQIIIHNRDNCCPERMRDISFDILDEGGTVIFSSQLLNAENALGSPPFIEIDVFAENGDAPVAGKSVIVRRAPDLDHSGAPGQTSNDDAYVLAMGEFIVMAEDIAAEPPDPLVIRNLAPEGTASQSSTNGAFTADRAIDGEVGNFTHTLASDLDPTWTLDLGKVSLINELIIRNRGDGCCPSRLRDITVSILDTDGTTVVWESELLNPENADGGPTLIDLELDGLAGSAVVGQFVRIHRTPDPDLSGGAGNEDEGYVLSLGEVEVLGISVDSYDPFITTDLEAAAAGQSASAFMRIPFQVDDPGALETLALDIQYDDGFIAYLNGTEIAARNAPASPAWDSAAAAERLDTDAVRVERIDLTAQLALLTAGENVLAFHALNASASDDDFLLRPRLTSTADGGQLNAYMEPPTPGAPNTSGFFIDRVADTKFSLNRGIYDDPIEVEITTATEGATIRYTVDGSKPSETNGAIYAGPISLSQTTVLRAIAYREDWRSTDVDTHTYLFLADVITQATMDTGITQSAIYGTQMQDALRSLPAVSLVFAGDIDRTEKETSVELIGFENGDLQVNAGMERYGAYATNFAKRNVRLNFRDRWGPKKLNYPLFDGHGGGRDPVTEFDALDLRMGSHDMKQRGFYLSNRFCDDTMMQMGHVSPHGRFVHLYVNGTYWGQYHLRERWNADMHAQYLGGAKDDYEAIVSNRGGVPWSVGLPYDGDGSAWANILALRGNYQAQKDYLNMPAFLDWMLMWMSGNAEYEHRSVGPVAPGSGFIPYLNDADGWTRAAPAGYVNDVGPENILGALRAEADPDFLTLLADRIHRHYFNDGLMTAAKVAERIAARADQINLSMIAEVARWGGSGTNDSYFSPADWVAKKDLYLNSTLPTLPATMIARFQTAGLYPATSAPEFSQHGGIIPAAYALAITAPAGAIYYTLDGTDPRLPGGALSPDAIAYAGEVTLPGSALVKARVQNGGEWSALTEAFFQAEGVPTVAPGDLAISEIHYNPSGSDELEFIELMNIADHAINLRGAAFTNGIRFTFSAYADAALAPGQRVILVKNLVEANAAYGLGLPVAGVFEGNLDNDGDGVTFADALGSPVQDFAYDDALPWPTLPDGGGASLVLVSPLSNPDHGDALSWRASLGGPSPGTGDPGAAEFTGDPDGDSDGNGLTDFQEYVFGPTGPQPVTGQFLYFDSGLGPEPHFTFSFPANLAATDAEIWFETSPDLLTWTRNDSAFVLYDRTDLGGGIENLHFRSANPMPPGNSDVFVRAGVRRR